jgi:hypothetical protein
MNTRRFQARIEDFGSVGTQERDLETLRGQLRLRVAEILPLHLPRNEWGDLVTIGVGQ